MSHKDKIISFSTKNDSKKGGRDIVFPFDLEALLPYLLPYLVGLVLFFLIIREIVTWYYKINLLVKQQNDQTQLLKEILERLNKRD
jgi:hypothetical protein